MHGAMSFRPPKTVKNEKCKEMALQHILIQYDLGSKTLETLRCFAETRPKNGAHKPLSPLSFLD